MNTRMELIDKHPNYRLLFFNEEQLRKELSNWSRTDLISWLKWNDPNGVYDDKQSIEELGDILSFEEGVEIIVKQVVRD